MGVVAATKHVELAAHQRCRMERTRSRRVALHGRPVPHHCICRLFQECDCQFLEWGIGMGVRSRGECAPVSSTTTSTRSSFSDEPPMMNNLAPTLVAECPCRGPGCRPVMRGVLHISFKSVHTAICRSSCARCVPGMRDTGDAQYLRWSSRKESRQCCSSHSRQRQPRPRDPRSQFAQRRKPGARACCPSSLCFSPRRSA